MTVDQEVDAGDFADRLTALDYDELFGLMAELDKQSEDMRPENRDSSDVFGKIAMVETPIEDRFPGQLLAPYRDWQQRRTQI